MLDGLVEYGVEQARYPSCSAQKWWHEVVPVLAVAAIAAALRFHALDQVPGLYHDEAYNGLDALRVLAGEHPIWFEANNGREPLFIYLVAVAIRLCGRTPAAIRLVSATLGTLTVVATYLMAREMFGWRVAWLAALLTGIIFWTVSLSRIGFRAVALPLLSALTIWGVWRACRRRTRLAWLLAGALWGLSLYTYLAARFTVLIWIPCAAYCWRSPRHRATRQGWMIFALTAFLVALPLSIYAVTHLDAFFARSGQIGIWQPEIGGSQPWRMLLAQTARAALMFIYRGDFIPRHNLPLRPVFDPLIAPFFVGGVLLTLGRLRQESAYPFLLLWTGVMLLPTILAEGAPHFLRAVGVLPVALLFPALALDVTTAWLSRHAPRTLVWGALGAVLLASAGLTCRDYFLRLAPSETLYYNLEAGATALAVDVNRFLGTGWQGTGLYATSAVARTNAVAYLDRRLWEGWASLAYLIPATERLVLIDPANPPAPMAGDCDIAIYCWPYADSNAAWGLVPANGLIMVSAGSKERGDLESEARLLYVKYSATRQQVPRQLAVAFEDGIILWDADISAPAPDRLLVRLYWEARAPITASYTVFVHARRGEQMLGQDDSPPGLGRYPTNRWRVGDLVADAHLIALSSPCQPGDEVWVGLYQLESQRRLQVLSAAGAPLGDHVTLSSPCKTD